MHCWEAITSQYIRVNEQLPDLLTNTGILYSSNVATSSPNHHPRSKERCVFLPAHRFSTERESSWSCFLHTRGRLAIPESPGLPTYSTMAPHIPHISDELDIGANACISVISTLTQDQMAGTYPISPAQHKIHTTVNCRYIHVTVELLHELRMQRLCTRLYSQCIWRLGFERLSYINGIVRPS